jgi:hypothetical protein
VELKDSMATFENEDNGTRLIYECPADDALTITLEKVKNGKTSRTVFSFHRMSGE